MAMRAAIDIGGNSLRLMVGEIGPDRQSSSTIRRWRKPGLATGLGSGNLGNNKTIGRTFAVAILAAALGRRGVASVRVFATSAIRDAANREEFSKEIAKRFVAGIFGFCPGKKEAYFPFTAPYPRFRTVGKKHCSLTSAVAVPK